LVYSVHSVRALIEVRSCAAGYREQVTAAARERVALVRTLRDAGPEAPTLCEGWATKDLVAHLVLRERRPDAALGIALAPLAGYPAKIQRRLTASTEWSDLLAMLAAGPPLYSPFKLLDPLVNIAERFIHHEDVRRARVEWTPRELDARMVAGLRRMVPLMSRMSLAAAPARVTLREHDGAMKPPRPSRRPKIPTAPTCHRTDAIPACFAGSPT